MTAILRRWGSSAYFWRCPDIYDELYDRVIQFGGHPNEKSISGSLKLDLREADTQLREMLASTSDRIKMPFVQCMSPVIGHIAAQSQCGGMSAAGES